MLMPSSDRIVRIYEELAEREHRQGTPQARDRFLILAADAALSAGLTADAERFRARLLDYNPHHLLRPYPSLTEALKSSDVYSYIADLRGSYPPGEAEKLLESSKKNGPEPTAPAGLFLPPSVGDRPGGDFPPPPPDPLQGVAGHEHGGMGKADDAPRLFGSPQGTLPSLLPTRKTLAVHEPEAAAEAEEAPAESEEQGEAGAGLSTWLSDALFVLLLVAGVALAGYTLARPFLSLPDSPLRQ
jgi:hypothetical protein